MGERRQDKNVNKAPEFNHNIMGSSAGAGSGEFHLYRQMRRKEASRTRILHARKVRDELNEAYHLKLDENQRLADEKTAKKRKKRQKQKQKQKSKKTEEKKETSESESDPESDKDENLEKPDEEPQSVETVAEKDDDDCPTSQADQKGPAVKKDLVIYYA